MQILRKNLGDGRSAWAALKAGTAKASKILRCPLAVALMLLVAAAAAETNTTFITFSQAPQVRAEPEVNGFAYLVIDPFTNTAIVSHNAEVPHPPASLAKIMTAYVVAEKLASGEVQLQSEVEVSENAMGTPGSRMFIQTNLPVTLDQLLFGMIVSSGNDASVAIAEHISGSEADFVDEMNLSAHSLGMRNCLFANSHGLHHPDMLCSLSDLLLLAKSLIERHPAFYQRYFGTTEFSYNNINQQNRNILLQHKPEEYDGIKTGFTGNSNYNLVVSAKRDYRLIAGVLGADDPELARLGVTKLINHTYLHYRRYLHYREGENIAAIRVYQGAQRELPLGVEEDLHATLPFAPQVNFTARLELPPIIYAPVSQGEILGELVISYPGSAELLKRPLIALADVPQGNWLQRSVDTVAIWFGW